MVKIEHKAFNENARMKCKFIVVHTHFINIIISVAIRYEGFFMRIYMWGRHNSFHYKLSADTWGV